MRLRALFTDAEIQDAIECSTNIETGEVSYAQMAQMLSDYERCDVSRQLARYWARQFDVKKKNGDSYLTLTVANRKLKQQRELRPPKPNDHKAKIEQSKDSSRILFITDMHAPYHHADTLHFLKAVKEMYQPTMIIHGGDEVDNHALSFHDADPDLASAGQELLQAQLFLEELEALFPDMRICESNHGSLLYRKAKVHGIPVAYLKTYRDILFPEGGGEGWSWHDKIRIEMPHGKDLQFQHSCTGDLMKGAAHENANLFVGHEHSKFGIGYSSNTVETFYSVYGGCLVDNDALAFSYGKLFPNKPVVGAVVILHGIPHLIPMLMDRYGRWTGVVV